MDYGQNNYKDDIKGTLEKNITFFNNDPIDLLMQIIRARKYNDPMTEFNDIMLVSIPKEGLENNKEDIIIEKNDSKYLNPEYIKGYVRVGVEKGNIESFIGNPIFKEKEQKENIDDLNIEDWKNKFETWYQDSKTTKMQKIRTNIMCYLKSILNKEKQQDKEQVERDIL